MATSGLEIIEDQDLMCLATQGLVPIESQSSFRQPDYDSCDMFDELFTQVHLETLEASTRFATPATDEDVQEAQQKAVPHNTLKATNWAVNAFKEWSAHRRSINKNRCPSHLFIMAKNKFELNYWMTRFVLEARRKDGKEYPPNTLHQICCGILRFIREIEPDIDIFKDTAFKEFQRTLDSEMMRLRRNGLGCNPRKANPITEDEEELLWSTGVLGDKTPQTLVNTIVYMCGLFFALRSGSEHRQLKMNNIELVEKSGEPAQLVYTECVSKTCQGGLKNRKVKPKQVAHHQNLEKPERCFIRMYKKYIEHLPEAIGSDTPFYLTPIPKPKGKVWFKKTPIGVHTLEKTVSTMCKNAGVSGYKTNHSLRVTTATRLFQSGLDEQLIMERTGHRSTAGVRSYKRTSNEQKQAVSAVLNQTKRPKTGSQEDDVIELTTGVRKPLLPLSSASNCGKLDQPTKEKPSFLLEGCSGVTINFNYH